MRHLKLPLGMSDFEEIRQNSYYYIDKSGLISDLLVRKAAKVTLITRPRRFGKTLGMSMLAHFFDIEKDSRALFEGLEISKQKELCVQWMNQYPVIFLTFRKVDGLNFKSAYEMLEVTIAEFCQRHSFLMESEKIAKEPKEIFQRLKECKAFKTELKNSLELLTRMMQIHYGRPVILLLDEYDVPIAKASSNGYYKEMLEVMKAMLGSSLKDNPSVKFAVITGCLKVAKESIFTGTNNFVSDSILSFGFSEYFGFTQKETEKLLLDADAAEYAPAVRKWYDGYHFGNYDIYCPWDVLNYLHDLQDNPQAKPASYWKNTSDNAIIRSFIDYAGSNITRKMETLLSGGYIVQQIEENLTYDYLHSSEENLWSILYLTGYLTTAQKEGCKENLKDGEYALQIPNAEVMEIFESTIKKWFDDTAKLENRQKLFNAVWNGNDELLTDEMTRLLRTTISYHDYGEDFYHAFLAGIFAGAGYPVESNKEHGEGRSDVIVYNPREAKVAVFEAKYAKKLCDMDKACDMALLQINERMYAEEFADDYDEILCYGISFFRKRCRVRKR